jgi:hypothetical protein
MMSIVRQSELPKSLFEGDGPVGSSFRWLPESVELCVFGNAGHRQKSSPNPRNISARFASISAVVFTKRLREGVRTGKITCSVRIWKFPHVKPGNRYRMEEGHIEVESIEQISIQEITPQLARESAFLGLIDLLKVAQHGPGENVYLIRFHYIAPRRA